MITTNPTPLSSERLALLYRLPQTFNSSLDLDEALNRVMDEVTAAVLAGPAFTSLLCRSTRRMYEVHKRRCA